MHPALALAALLLLSAARPAAAQLIPPARPIAGATQEEWSKRWWRWALSFEDEDSPVADPDGRLCASGQSGPVWFLAGSYDTRRTVRSCRLPAGKTLFFPLINTLAIPPDDEREACASLMLRAEAQTEAPAALVLEFNGRRFSGLDAHRQATHGCFLVAPDDDAPAAGNGYYVALGPLKRGRYTLNFGGILPGLSQAVTYTLDVR
ncbi:MAG: copper resistance protein CopC [Comamonadaceae bacterium]|nr:copper resistance protein CopC [Comamonadaceae bacterium]